MSASTETLDTLANQALEDLPCQEVTGIEVGFSGANQHKPVLPEKDEPELNSPTAPVRASIFRRGMMQRMQATERRIAFARALIANAWDGRKALVAAGYKDPEPKNLQAAVKTMTNHPEVRSELQRIRTVLEQQSDAMSIDLTKEWVAIASSDIFDFFNEVEDGDGVVSLSLKPKRELTKASRRAVKAIKIRRRRMHQKDGDVVETEDIEVQLWDKHAALDSLAKIQGLYQDKQADAINNLTSQIVQRTERAREKIGRTFDVEGQVDQQAG